MSEDLVDAPETADPRDDPTPVDGVATDDEGARGRWRERRRTRVSRWDRPPPPKDWRYFVGTLGKILIATGLLMFGFVAYQLWGTGIETARAQNKLEDTFEQRLATNATTDDDTDTDSDTDSGTESVDSVGDATGDDAEPADPSDASDATDPTVSGDGEPATAPGVGGTTSDVVPGGIDVSDGAVDQDVPVVPGEAFAKIDIAKIDIDDLYVIPGVQLDDLKKGPGHYPSTPLPGQLGNASLAGHRTTYGAPFFDLDQLAPGDEIVVTMVTGDQFVYRVTGSQVVTAADSWVITTRDPNVAELTLTTCDPKYTARNRLVVHSVLVPERSSQVGVAEFYDLDEPEIDNETAGDDPTVTSPDPTQPTLASEETSDETVIGSGDTDSTNRPDASVATPADDIDDADDASTADAVDDTDAADDPDDPDEAAAAPDDAEIDAFSEGWFHDPGAWPQIALWAGVLTLISVLAYQLAKKTRHSSVGVLVGIVPFVVALYFFYQNVNRLLPPGL